MPVPARRNEIASANSCTPVRLGPFTSHGHSVAPIQPAYHNPVASVPVAMRHTELTTLNHRACPCLGPFSSHSRNAVPLQSASRHAAGGRTNIPSRSPACAHQDVDRSRLGAFSSHGRDTTAPTPAPHQCDIPPASANHNVGFPVCPTINSRRQDNAHCTIQTEAVIHRLGNAVSPSSVMSDGNNLQFEVQRQDPTSETGPSHFHDDEYFASNPEYEPTGYYNNYEKHVNFPETYDRRDEVRVASRVWEDPVNRLAYLLTNSLKNKTSTSNQNNSVLNRMSYARSLP